MAYFNIYLLKNESGENMKKALNALSIILSSLFLVSCNPISAIPFETKYAMYYEIDQKKVGEIYCWKNNGEWESGILELTEKDRTIEEVKWLQDELPCPILGMRDIVDTFHYGYRFWLKIYIVSMPPKSEELRRVVDYENQRFDYIYLYKVLDLPLPSYLQ